MRVLIVTHLELKRVVPSYLKNIVEDGLLPWMSELLSILSNDDTNEYYVVSTSANLARDYHFTKDGINFSVLGLKARLIGRLPFFLRVVLGLSTIKCRFHKIVRKINPDIVSIHGTYGDVQYYAANLKLPKILTIDMFYDLYLNAEESFIHRLYARKEKQLLKRITFYTYRTQIMKEKILETNPSATLFHFCYPIDTVSGTKSYSSVLQREVDMIFAARLHEYKGVFDFIDIMHEVSRYLPDIKVLIIGMGGPEIIAKIHSRILTLGLAKQVSFIPNIENKRDFLKYLESAKLNVYPVSESMISGTMIESLSSGTPIITYESPIVDQLNADKMVILSAKCNIKDMSLKVIEVLCDPDLLATLAERSKALFRRSYYKDRNETMIDYKHALFNAHKFQTHIIKDMED